MAVRKKKPGRPAGFRHSKATRAKMSATHRANHANKSKTRRRTNSKAKARKIDLNKRVAGHMKGIRKKATIHTKYLKRRKAATGGKPGRPRLIAVKRAIRRRVKK